MYVDKLFNLRNKVAAVIGGGGHLCSEMAKSFARAGSKVAIIDLRLHKAQDVEQEIKRVEIGVSQVIKQIHGVIFEDVLNSTGKARYEANNNDYKINEVIDSDEKIEEESQFSLFEKSDIEFISDENEEEVVHNMDDDYDECEDTFENDGKDIETLDRTEDVVIEELDGYDDNEVDHSSKKNDYISKRKERINNYKNNIYKGDPYHQKLAIPAFKRKNINLDEEDSLQTGNSKTIDFSEED